MHEQSIALSIVDVACEELQRQGGGRAIAVHLKLGPLSGVIKEALLSAYAPACQNSPLAGSKLIIEETPVEIDCPKCNGPRRVESVQEMKCIVCGTFSSDVVSGRELEVTAMEVVDERSPAPG